MNFKDKKILVTGASRGIGRATAIAFAKQGASVGINFKSNTAEANLTLNAMRGDSHQLFQRDISITTEAQGLIHDFIEHYGKIDVLVNNAGIAIAHDIDLIDFEH